MKNLRLLIDPPRSGAMNMAIDEALMQHMLQDGSSSHGFLRFYKWEPATLSFGYNQPIHRLVDIEKVQEAGLGIVRRMSGGKMVFHADEWTFSLGLPREILRQSSQTTFLQMFVTAVEPLVNALRDLNIPARFADGRHQKAASENNVHCYAAAAGHSIFAGPEKLIGAAGVAKGDFLIIHGSIPIQASYPPSELFLCQHRIEQGVSMACLKNFLDTEKIELLPEMVAQKFSQDFSCMVTKYRLSAEEIATASSLENEKYAQLNWKEKNIIG